jgi:hypothetical protein
MTSLQPFDLNVHNYSLSELLDFFGLTKNDADAEVDRKCTALKRKISNDPKLGPVTRGKMHDFLNKAVQRLEQSRTTTAEMFMNKGHKETGHKETGHKETGHKETGHKETGTGPKETAPTQFMDMKNEVNPSFVITRPSHKLGIEDNFKTGTNALRGAPPGILNPLSINTIKRAVNIDTRFRTNYYTTKSTDFIFNIPQKFENIVSMSVATYQLPLTYFAVSQQYENNCILFQWESTPSDPSAPTPNFNKQYTLIIPDGNYRTSFQTGGGAIIENTINGILAGTDIVQQTGLAYTADATSGRSVFACNTATDASGNRYPYDTSAPTVQTPYTGAFRIVFNVKASINRTAESATGVSSTQSDTRPLPYFLGWELGYRTAMYEMRGGLDPSGNLTVPQAAVSEGICMISGPQYVFLCIDDFNNNVNNYYASAYGSSTIAPNIIARLNIRQQISTAGAYGVVSGESLTTSLTYSREYFGPVDIQRMRITLVDDFGRVMDLNNMDWSFALMFECVYSSSSA